MAATDPVQLDRAHARAIERWATRLIDEGVAMPWGESYRVYVGRDVEVAVQALTDAIDTVRPITRPTDGRPQVRAL
jgi:hypothetical protein